MIYWGMHKAVTDLWEVHLSHQSLQTEEPAAPRFVKSAISDGIVPVNVLLTNDNDSDVVESWGRNQAAVRIKLNRRTNRLDCITYRALLSYQ